MSEENVEIVRKLSEAFNHDGLEGMRAFLDPDIEFHEDPSFPEGGVYHGFAYLDRDRARKAIGLSE